MAMREASAIDERKKTVFGLNYTRALSIAIDKATEVRAKPEWTSEKKEQLKTKLTKFVNDNTSDQKEVAKGMLSVSKNPGETFRVLKFGWNGDTREIANQFLAIFKPNVEKMDPNIEVTIEMKGNWITVWAKNKQTPQVKTVEKQLPTGPLVLNVSDDEAKGGELSDSEEKPGGSGAGKKPAAQ